MKKSEAIQRLNEFIYKQGPNAEKVLDFCVQELGMHPSARVGYDWEPELQGLNNGEYVEREYPRNLPTSNIVDGRPIQVRMHAMAEMWNQGSSLVEIAESFNVTRERVRQCLAKVEQQSKSEEER